MRRRLLHRGFTVIELAVYMAILAAMSILVVSSIVQLSGVFRLAQSERRVLDAATNATDRLLREMRLACVITSISGTSITLRTFPSFAAGQDRTACTVSKSFALSSGKIIQDGDANKTLTELNVTVTNSDIFTEILGATQKAVRIKLVIASGVGRYQVTRTYYGMAVLRGSY